MQKGRLITLTLLAAIVACVSSGRGNPPPKSPMVNEPADLLAAIKQCGGQPYFDDAGRVWRLRVSNPTAAAMLWQNA